MPDQARIQAAWSSLDRAALVEHLRDVPALMFATVSGAHLYGFSSADSDVDLRGAFVTPARGVLGLREMDATHSVDTVVDGKELDLVAHDIRKFARMMTRHNGYVLEQLLSPLIVVTSPDHEELCRIGRGCITRPLFRHYRGFAHSRRKLLGQPGATVKHLLYAYRVYLSGIHVLRSGDIEANLPQLNEAFRLPQIETLLARKCEGLEREALRAGELDDHDTQLDRLETELEKAHATSRLPEHLTTFRELDDFVVRVRLATVEAPL